MTYIMYKVFKIYVVKEKVRIYFFKEGKKRERERIGQPECPHWEFLNGRALDALKVLKS